MFSNSNSFIRYSKNLVLFSNESTRVTSSSGYAIFRTTPGKPAPVPISHSFTFLLSISGAAVNES